jgi:hypothetical protein
MSDYLRERSAAVAAEINDLRDASHLDGPDDLTRVLRDLDRAESGPNHFWGATKGRNDAEDPRPPRCR